MVHLFCSFISGNFCFQFSAQCLCRVSGLYSMQNIVKPLKASGIMKKKTSMYSYLCTKTSSWLSTVDSRIIKKSLQSGKNEKPIQHVVEMRTCAVLRLLRNFFLQALLTSHKEYWIICILYTYEAQQDYTRTGSTIANRHSAVRALCIYVHSTKYREEAHPIG